MKMLVEKLRGLPASLLLIVIPTFRNTTASDSKVAWLDGLRGFAAVLVYLEHYVGFTHEGIHEVRRGFGWHGNHYFICFPGIRLFFSGGYFAVAIFFIISGYVLSIRPLRYLHAEDHVRLSVHLGAGLPRRWVRLFFPVTCTTFLFMTSWHLFGTESGNPTSQSREPTYLADVTKWSSNMRNQTYFFENEPFYRDFYNPHVWAIATEFRGSVVVYLTLLISIAFTGYGAGVRLLGEICLIFYSLFVVDAWYIALFIMGMLLCDLDLLADRGETFQPPKALSRLALDSKLSRSLIYHALLVGAIYLGGVPHVDRYEGLREHEPGWQTLSLLIPPAVTIVRWFFLFWSATCTMIVIPRIVWLRAMFQSALFQYLGRISFGLYLIHGPIMWTFGERVYAAVGRPRVTSPDRIPQWINSFSLSDSGPLGLEVNTLLPQIILFPLTLWFAGIVDVSIIEPGMKLSSWLFSPSGSGYHPVPLRSLEEG